MDGMRRTPLTVACNSGDEKIVRLLIDKGVDVNQVDGMRETPLRAASKKNNKEIVQLLINKGGDVNQVGGIRGTHLIGFCKTVIERIEHLLKVNEFNVNLCNDLSIRLTQIRAAYKEIENISRDDGCVNLFCAYYQSIALNKLII
ncbi:GA-binding protein subunit beta-1-like [Mytilus edulis]|uniref:GA-binding protein subunit beta-1-like n=1 Tax=Mytilus edulis TaxID=6550 RepID=UPI0039EFF21C